MNIGIECRSPQEIADDDLIFAHSMCEEALRAVVPGQGYLYRGQHWLRIVSLRDKLASLIEQGQPWTRRVSASRTALYVIHGA